RNCAPGNVSGRGVQWRGQGARRASSTVGGDDRPGSAGRRGGDARRSVFRPQDLQESTTGRRRTMATLTVVKFPTAGGADQMIGTLEKLQQERLITIEDAAIVTWPMGKKGPKTRHLYSLAGVGALHGSFWGL